VRRGGGGGPKVGIAFPVASAAIAIRRWLARMVAGMGIERLWISRQPMRTNIFEEKSK
jgi:hypothetical protein